MFDKPRFRPGITRELMIGNAADPECFPHFFGKCRTVPLPVKNKDESAEIRVFLQLIRTGLLRDIV
jgi:hypothetical protein